MTLPPEVLRLLGDDATPERVADEYGLRTSSRVAYMTQGGWPLPGEAEHAATVALMTYRHALAAAAIRECETGRAFTAALKLPKEQFEVASDAEVKHREAMDAYDALRNWKQQP